VSSTRAASKVLFVANALEPAGAERVLIAVASGLDRARFAPSVLCLHHMGRAGRRGVRRYGAVACRSHSWCRRTRPLRVAAMFRAPRRTHLAVEILRLRPPSADFASE